MSYIAPLGMGLDGVLRYFEVFLVFQIRRIIKEQLAILYKNIFCDLTLELSRRDGFNEGPQYLFSLGIRNKLSLNYSQYHLLSGALIS